MIYLVGETTTESGTQSCAQQATFEQFTEWANKQRIYQLDTETNVCGSILDRVLILVQFGDVYGKDQWLLQWSALTKQQQDRVGWYVENPYRLKIAHNSSFEYQVFRKQGYRLAHIWDTMHAEKLLYAGIETPIGFHSLKGLLERYYGLDISKGEQTTFGDNILTNDKLLYAAKDVQYLGGLMISQKYKLDAEKLENVAALEFAVCPALAEMEYLGMKLDPQKWLANLELAQPVIDEYKQKLDEFLCNEEFREAAIAEGFLTAADGLSIPWNSPKVRQEFLQLLYPTIKGAGKPIVQKFLKDNTLSVADQAALEAFLEKDYSLLDSFLLEEHPALLEEKGYFLKKNTCLINWASPPQRLKVFQVVEPKLSGTSKEELAKCEHPIIEAYQEYINATKLKTAFGEKFLTDYMDADSRVRTRFNQIISTGRMSSSNPNLQQIPAKENVGQRYRNCFVEDEGWVFVDSDFASQELVLIAFFSKDPVWAEALNQGQDLHSVCAEQVFGKKWKEAAEDGCAYYTNNKDKCKCKKHKTLRTLVKTINFGLAYGMSKFKLSATAKISLEEAQKTIDDYFAAFPGIGGRLNAFGAYGRKKGFIVTPAPFFRKRYYGEWSESMEEYELGRIERQSKNHPIQGGAADITKTALWLVYETIKEKKLWDKVRPVACIHDQITCTVKAEYAEEWAKQLHQCMLDAGKLVVTSGQLGADTNITDVWAK